MKNVGCQRVVGVWSEKTYLFSFRLLFETDWSEFVESHKNKKTKLFSNTNNMDNAVQNT